jgi:hypothetical protein
MGMLTATIVNVLLAAPLALRIEDARTGAAVAGARVAIHVASAGGTNCDAVEPGAFTGPAVAATSDAGGNVEVDIAPLLPPPIPIVPCDCPPGSASCAPCLESEQQRRLQPAVVLAARVEHSAYVTLERSMTYRPWPPGINPGGVLWVIPRSAAVASVESALAALRWNGHASGGLPRAWYPLPSRVCFKDGLWRYRFEGSNRLPNVEGTVDVAGRVHLDDDHQGAYAVLNPGPHGAIRLRERVLRRSWLCPEGEYPYEAACRVAGRELAGDQWSEDSQDTTRNFRLVGPADERCAREGCEKVECLLYHCRPVRPPPTK